MAVELYCGVQFSCYIGLSRSNSSLMGLAQQKILHTTCVTASTAPHIPTTTNRKQGKHSWRNYLIAAPMLWLA